MIQSKTILNAIPKALQTTDIPELGKKHQGKVRDFYILSDKRVTITTDRQSAFDLNLGIVPFKGAVLNQLAAFWFEKTKHIVPNHLISIPDPNVLISKNCEPIPVEMVVRGYLSGVANTSIWYSYEKGEREMYGMTFPDGMHKNQKLPTNIITPTTHPEVGSGKHDERLTREEIIKRKIVDKKLYEQMEKVALELFAFGQKWCEKHGLILVDTKYEFGLYEGKLMLIDEIHTPDSSRFWIAKTYKERLAKGLEPENFDKEFIRLWYTTRVNPYKDKVPPMSKELIIQASQRYIKTYEMLTDKKFSAFEYPIEERIKKNVKKIEGVNLFHIEGVNLDQKHTTIDKLKICKQTRKIAADSLYTVLKKLLYSNKPISEVMLRNAWLKEMQKNKNIFPEGWYQPPPYGIIILFADDQKIERINYKSARPEDKWSRDDIFLDSKNGLIYCYASPVDKETGVIGDFGITLYFGKNLEIKNLLKKCLELDKELFAYVNVGMTLGDLSTKAEELMKKDGMGTDATPITDLGELVIGHTIPNAYENWNSEEKLLIKDREKNWLAIRDIISHRRINIKKNESFIIKKDDAVTIEPRPKIIDRPYLPTALSYHTIALFKKDGSKELLTGFDELFTLAGMSYMIKPMKQQKQKITYSQTGVDYNAMDPIKIFAQLQAKSTAKSLKRFGMSEVTSSRGESAYIWEEKDSFRAFVIEGLGTKNLVADEVRKFSGKTHYDTIAQDTVAMIINDLIVLGADPQVITAYFAVGDSSWFTDKKRSQDLVEGWAAACKKAGAVWGGGETPTLKGVIESSAIDLAGSAVGIIEPKERLTSGERITTGDAIILIASSGIHANGITLTRTIAEQLPQGYKTKLTDGKTFGESILVPTYIYAELVRKLFAAEINIHYMVNITGHGWRKLMRAKQNFTYVITNVPPIPPIFSFIQEQSGNDDKEMYGNFNMGAGFAIFIPQKDIKKTVQTAKKLKLSAYHAGFVKKGERQVIINPKNITFKGDTLKVRE